MTGNVNSKISALHEAVGLDLRATKAGYHSNTSAEILRFRHPHNSDGAAHGLPLNDDQERALLHLIKAGDFDTRQNLVTRNLRVVLRTNRRYANMGIRIFDLLKAGNRGLEHALENFEQEGGGCFSTYAASCIRQNIEHIILQRDVHGMPRHGKSDGQCRLISVGGAQQLSVRLVLD